jgi:hypothetical protein
MQEQPAVVGSTEPETFDQDQDSQQGLIMGGESADQKKRFSYDDLREQHRRFQKIPPPPPPSVQQPGKQTFLSFMLQSSNGFAFCFLPCQLVA